ncbi:MAG: sulfurtransferase [Candidatus Obscuribacterales bacterium]|nr:sulfurtransferase [Candidatus Obscuribacterales bacterium]
MEIVNLAAYKFVGIAEPTKLRPILKRRSDELKVMGSILLSPEGINMFVASERNAIDNFLDFLRHDEPLDGLFTDIEVKESFSDHQPFRRMVVRIKPEIITMQHPAIVPGEVRAPAVEPEVLKKWLDQGHDDEGREVVLMDTRNAFEVNIGTFNKAFHYSIEKFSQFPQAFRDTDDDTKAALRQKTIVSFCTGGIRCEKAALFLRECDLDNVFQLNGGILKYFENVGDAHWNGECFVFDRRVALDPQLRPTTKQYDSTASVARTEAFLKWQAKKVSE